MMTSDTDKQETPETTYDATADNPVFERPSVTVDVVALTALENKLCVLLIRRGTWPFEGIWAFPGGFVRMEEELDEAARRELCEETGVAGANYLEQLYTFGRLGRDPRTRVISVAYYALLPGPRSALTDEPCQGSDAVEAQWFPVDALPGKLAFDHEQILTVALARLRAKLGYTSVAYALLPDEFTLTELQNVYEIILGTPLDKRNFRKRMLATSILAATSNQRQGGAHRPAQLYRFTRHEMVLLG